MVPWNNKVGMWRYPGIIFGRNWFACSPYLTMAAGSSSKTYNQGVPPSKGWESLRSKDFVMGFGWGIVAGRVRYRGKQGRRYYSRPQPELNHPWNNFWWLWRLYTGGQKLVRLLVRGWYLWVSSSSASTSKACGVQALPLLHVCHKKKLPPSGCHIDCMLEVALNYSWQLFTYGIIFGNH